jgi:maltooligosyltrehalose trehalohydrolase
VPDPQDEATFRRSTLDPSVRDTEPNRTLWMLYKSLIAIRKRFALGGGKPEVRCHCASKMITLEYAKTAAPLAIVFHFGDEPARVHLPSGFESLRPMLDSSKPSQNDALQLPNAGFDFGPHSFVIFESMRSGEKQ